MQNKEMEYNIKMHRSDKGIIGVQSSDSARDSYDLISRPGAWVPQRKNPTVMI
jgi:hypothetical protein